MKKAVIKSLALFFFSIVCQSIYRGFSSDAMIKPFPWATDTAISIAWYAKDLCDLFSFAALMLCVVYIFKPIEKHLAASQWIGHNAMLVFVKMWHRIFFVVAVTGGLDIIHYLLSFKQTHWFFLVQNAIFFIMTFYYLFKAYRK